MDERKDVTRWQDASLEDFKSRALQLESTYARFWAAKDEETVSKTQAKKMFAAGALPQPTTPVANTTPIVNDMRCQWRM